LSINFQGKVIVVTGSSKGLGRELAFELAKLGADVVLNYYCSSEDAIKTINAIQNINKRAIMVRADVGNQEDVQMLYKETMRKFGKVDILVNNAGIGKGQLASNMKIESWDNVINTNLKGCFLCCKQFAKQMMRQNSGKIINISSQMSEAAVKGLSSYSSSKAAINSLTKTLAVEYSDYNIAVNAICPGYIPTTLNSGHPPINKSLLDNEYNLQDFINFATFLMSDKLQNVSGQIFNLDSRI